MSWLLITMIVLAMASWILPLGLEICLSIRIVTASIEAGDPIDRASRCGR